jgi:hypothetical protein
MTQRLIAVQAGERDWRERPRLIFATFAYSLEAEPATARSALADARAAGHAAIEQVQRAKSTFDAMIGESFARAPDGIAVPPMVIEGWWPAWEVCRALGCWLVPRESYPGSRQS